MTFLAPSMLWLLLVVPILVGVYVTLLSRRKRAAIGYANLALVKHAIGHGAGVRRHLPPALFLMGAVFALLATARPSTMFTFLSERALVVLAMDVSISMRANDVAPDRITAARTAAKAFIADMPDTMRVAVVAFAGSAMLAQPPTTNREALNAAIDGFVLQRATAIGSAILMSLETIFPGVDFGQQALPEYQRSRDAASARALDQPAPAVGAAPLAVVTPGSYKQAVVILLTDGQATAGPHPVAAARMAAARGVRVFTLGLGTDEGVIPGWNGQSIQVQFDEETLKTIADLTVGKYYHAGSGADLAEIYRELNTQLIQEREQTELSFLFAALAALLIVGAGGLSVLWSSRLD